MISVEFPGRVISQRIMYPRFLGRTPDALSGWEQSQGKVMRHDVEEGRQTISYVASSSGGKPLVYSCLARL